MELTLDMSVFDPIEMDELVWIDGGWTWKGIAISALGGAAAGAATGMAFGGIGAGPGAMTGAFTMTVGYLLSDWANKKK